MKKKKMMFMKMASTVAMFALTPSPECTIETRRFSTPTATGNLPITKYERLLSWLRDQGAEINESIVIQDSFRGGGLGAVVGDAVKEGEMLFTIPRKACVTLENAKDDGKCGESFETLIKKAGPGGETVCMAGFLAKEYLCNDEESDSGFGPYLATLPWERGINNQEHVLFWSDDDVEKYLKGSLCEKEAGDLREEVDLAIKVLNGIVGPSIREYRGEDVESDDSGFSWPWEAKPKPELGPVEGLADAVKGAFVCLLTRSFQDGEGVEEKLAPLLDMLQHSDEPNVSHVMRKVDGTVEVRAKRDIEAGEELLNQYRSELEEAMPYHRFFTRYGFVPGITEPMQDLLKDRSSIFYAKKAEI